MRAVVYILAYRSNERVSRLLESEGMRGQVYHVMDNDPGGPSPIIGEHIIMGPGGGFTPGFNACLRHYRANYDHNEYLPVILNDDVTLEAGCIEAMVAPIADDATIGIVAPMQVDMKNPAMVICGGFGAAYPAGQHKSGLRGDPSIKREFSRWVTFCAVAINPSLIDDIGYLDEWMKMYYSDSDYCFRAQEAGYKMLFEPAAILRHENHGASAEFLHERAATRKLIWDKWHFDNKWAERVKVHLS